MKTGRLIISVAGALILALIGLAAWRKLRGSRAVRTLMAWHRRRESQAMRTLKWQTVAPADVDSGERITYDLRDKQREPSYAELSASYRTVSGFTLFDLIEELVGNAKYEGWCIESVNDDKTRYRFTPREMEATRIVLHISLDSLCDVVRLTLTER